MYYRDKIEIIKDIFNAENIRLTSDLLIVDDRNYPIIDDVIILLEENQYTYFVKKKLKSKFNGDTVDREVFSSDIQYSFGEEWKNYDKILLDYKEEFLQYFDIVDVNKLNGKRVCDLGCGNGRWSYFLRNICKEIILIDFSDAIFTARKNLADANNCLFFMCDLKKIPFKNDFVDFLFCLGVLHHMPTFCLDEVRNLKKYAKVLLIFLYYSLDNRPIYYRIILKLITFFRRQLSGIRNPYFRKAFSCSGTYLIYLPLIYLGYLLKPLNVSSYVPLYEFYKNKSVKRIQQDVYDRFFTSIEQRVSRKDIFKLKDTFSNIIMSDAIPYWHFLCER